LPNINELKSIVDENKSDPAIVDGFAHVQATYYWTSTSYFNGNAWFVEFSSGASNNYYQSMASYVRCVRAGE